MTFQHATNQLPLDIDYAYWTITSGVWLMLKAWNTFEMNIWYSLLQWCSKFRITFQLTNFLMYVLRNKWLLYPYYRMITSRIKTHSFGVHYINTSWRIIYLKVHKPSITKIKNHSCQHASGCKHGYYKIYYMHSHRQVEFETNPSSSRR